MTDLPLQAMAFAQTLALEAASMVQQAARQSNAVEFKSPGDWCSAVDRRIEAHLRARMAA